MSSRTKKLAHVAVAAIGVAAAFTLAGPAGTAAAAAEKVECNPTVDQVKIKLHGTGGDGYMCFVGEGVIAFPDGTWIDEVSTAGGDVLLFDHNGETVKIDPRTAMRYPNRPPHIKRVEIGSSEWQPAAAPVDKKPGEWQPAAAPVDKKPGENSSAMQKVACDPTVDQVKIKYHRKRETNGSGYECFTGMGAIDLEKGTWIDEVYVENSDLLLYDANGDTVPLAARTSIRYPNRPPHIIKLETLPAAANWVSAVVPWTSSAW